MSEKSLPLSPQGQQRLAEMSQQLRGLLQPSTDPLDPRPDRRHLRQQEVCKITGAANGGGKYEAVIVDNFPATGASSGDTLDAATLGTEGAAVIVYNLDEIGAGTHDLATGSYVLCTAHHTVVSDDKTKWVYLTGSGSGGGGGFWAKITDSYSVGNNIWNYSWTEQERTADSWQDLAGGRTGTANTATAAYNSVEANNNAAGLEGNSVNVDNLIDGFDLQPVQGDPVVWMREDDVAGDTVYSFSYENAIDGECETPTYTTVTSDYTVGATDRTVIGDATIPIEVTLLEAVTIGDEITVKNLSTETLTVTPDGTDTIDGDTGSFDIEEGESLDLQCIASGEWIIT